MKVEIRKTRRFRWLLEVKFCLNFPLKVKVQEIWKFCSTQEPDRPYQPSRYSHLLNWHILLYFLVNRRYPTSPRRFSIRSWTVEQFLLSLPLQPRDNKPLSECFYGIRTLDFQKHRIPAEKVSAMERITFLSQILFLNLCGCQFGKPATGYSSLQAFSEVIPNADLDISDLSNRMHPIQSC